MIRINLVGAKVTRVSGSGVQQLAVFSGILAVVLGGLFILHESFSSDLEGLMKKEKELKTKETEMQKIKGKVEALRQQNEQVEQRAKLIQNLNKVRTGPVRILKELATIIPKDVWIDGFTENGKVAEFGCTAVSPDHMIEFRRALEKSPFFYDVHDKGTTSVRSPIGGLDFQQFRITAKVVYAPKVVVDVEKETRGGGAAPGTAEKKAAGIGTPGAELPVGAPGAGAAGGALRATGSPEARR
ncbi:MAG: PilN domain-containing protein [Deltaproteobacteria bacterium]|nr:PilN domain-containing protein [Deltaproteobacteria bacterium]